MTSSTSEKINLLEKIRLLKTAFSLLLTLYLLFISIPTIKYVRNLPQIIFSTDAKLPLPSTKWFAFWSIKLYLSSLLWTFYIYSSESGIHYFSDIMDSVLLKATFNERRIFFKPGTDSSLKMTTAWELYNQLCTACNLIPSFGFCGILVDCSDLSWTDAKQHHCLGLTLFHIESGFFFFFRIKDKN